MKEKEEKKKEEEVKKEEEKEEEEKERTWPTFIAVDPEKVGPCPISSFLSAPMRGSKVF